MKSNIQKFGVKFCQWLLCLSSLSVAPMANSAPNNFESVIGNVLSCRDGVPNNIDYYRGYLKNHFGQPSRIEGEAEWYNSQNGKYMTMALNDVFISVPNSQFRFIGAIINAPLQDVVKTLEKQGVKLTQLGATYYRGAEGSYLLDYGTTQSKIYCVRKISNRVPFNFPEHSLWFRQQY